MIETVSINAERMRQYEFEHGAAEVERFLDAVLSIRGAHRPATSASARAKARRAATRRTSARRRARRTTTSGPRRASAARRRGASGARRRRKRFPPEPEKDLLLFLARACAAIWSRGSATSCTIVREEKLYFVPQMQTKIMNEGWASLLARADHARAGPAQTTSTSQFAQLHAGVLAPSRSTSTRTTSG